MIPLQSGFPSQYPRTVTVRSSLTSALVNATSHRVDAAFFSHWFTLCFQDAPAPGFSPVSLVVASQCLFLTLLSPPDLFSVHTDCHGLIWLYMCLSHSLSRVDLYLCPALCSYLHTDVGAHPPFLHTHLWLFTASCCTLLRAFWSQECACPKCQRIHALETDLPALRARVQIRRALQLSEVPERTESRCPR